MRGGRALPLVAGVLGFLISFAGSWIESFWWDEAATVAAADRSVPDLVDLLGRIDAVHGLYYLVMHGWFSVFGVGELSARIPSALAVGVGAAALLELARRLAGTRVAVVAAAVFVIMPRITWAGSEARSYAMVAAAAALTTLALVVALQSTRRWWWALYALLTALSVVLFLYSAALVVAHAVTVVLTPARHRWRFAVAVVAAAVVAAPFAVVAVSQSAQVGWVPPLDASVLYTIAVEQWFPGAAWFAAGCLLVVVCGALTVLWRRRPATPTGAVLVVAVPWLLIPMALFLAYSAFGQNIYLGRYLIFTAPAVALVVAAAAVRAFTSRVALTAVVLALTVAALPVYLEQRRPWGKPGGMDYSTVADDIEARASAGDCVAFQPTVSWQPTSLRSVAQARPDAFAGLQDIGFEESGADRGELWDLDAPAEVVADRARECTVVWVVTDGERSTGSRYLHPSNVWWEFAPFRFEDTELYRALAGDGFGIDERVPANHAQLVRLVRTGQTQ